MNLAEAKIAKRAIEKYANMECSNCDGPRAVAILGDNRDSNEEQYKVNIYCSCSQMFIFKLAEVKHHV